MNLYHFLMTDLEKKNLGEIKENVIKNKLRLP